MPDVTSVKINVERLTITTYSYSIIIRVLAYTEVHSEAQDEESYQNPPVASSYGLHGKTGLQYLFLQSTLLLWIKSSLLGSAVELCSAPGLQSILQHRCGRAD